MIDLSMTLRLDGLDGLDGKRARASLVDEPLGFAISFVPDHDRAPDDVRALVVRLPAFVTSGLIMAELSSITGLMYKSSMDREARQLGWLPWDSVEERLVEAIVARDRQARTVYADWLEDRGDVAHATFIRNLGDDGDGGIAGHAPREELGEAWLRAIGWLTEADEGGGVLGAACRDRHCDLNFGHGGTHW